MHYIGYLFKIFCVFVALNMHSCHFTSSKIPVLLNVLNTVESSIFYTIVIAIFTPLHLTSCDADVFMFQCVQICLLKKVVIIENNRKLNKIGLLGV